MEQLSDSNFKDAIKEGNVLIDFWAEWCGPCKMLGPVLEELSTQMTDIKFGKVNVDENPATPGSFSVRGIPTMVLFKNGEEVNRIVGFLPKEALKQKIEDGFK